LLVTTTNVEAERQVIWNLGAIAVSRRPEALDLFRRVLLASAAIPGVFPPVLIKVTVNGREYEELHADGGTVGQVAFVPQGVVKVAAGLGDGIGAGSLYVIRNGRLGPQWQAIEATTLEIASRSLSTLIKAQGRGDVERLQFAAQRSGIGFHLAAIPDGFVEKPSEPFDVAYMTKLFDLGYRRAANGYPWANAPP
jgi:hypothetical protein